jgi:hypothetical protein
LQAHLTTAWKAFTQAWAHTTPAQAIPVAAAEAEVTKALSQAHHRMQTHWQLQLQTRIAAQRAEQEAAARKRLEDEHRQEQHMVQVREAAVSKYQATMKVQMPNLESLQALTTAHQVGSVFIAQACTMTFGSHKVQFPCCAVHCPSKEAKHVCA